MGISIRGFIDHICVLFDLLLEGIELVDCCFYSWRPTSGYPISGPPKSRCPRSATRSVIELSRLKYFHSRFYGSGSARQY